jgi:hypothetical protein
MKFGSWTYDSSGIDLLPKADAGDISTFIPNGEWELIGERETRDRMGRRRELSNP